MPRRTSPRSPRCSPASRRCGAWSPRPSSGSALHGQRTILFVDEIHRFNKAQQDAFLPHVERGTVTLIGATTENPSFEVIAALLSRCRVYVLERLTEADLETIVRRAVGGRRARPGPARARARSRRRGGDRGALGGRRPHRAEHPGGRRAAPRRQPRGRRRAAAPHRRVDPGGGAAEGAPLRQGGRGALQPDQRAPQVGARLGPRRDALLAGPDARGGRGPALRRAAARPHGVRGRRAGRSPGARGRARGQGRVRLPRNARGRAGARGGGRLPRVRAEVERRLHRVRQGTRGRPRRARPSPSRTTSATLRRGS